MSGIPTRRAGQQGPSQPAFYGAAKTPRFGMRCAALRTPLVHPATSSAGTVSGATAAPPARTPSGLRTPAFGGRIPSRTGIPARGQLFTPMPTVPCSPLPPEAGARSQQAGAGLRPPQFGGQPGGMQRLRFSPGVPGPSGLQAPQAYEPPGVAQGARPRPKSGNAALGAIPKVSSRSVGVQRTTKSGPQIATTSASRTIMESQQRTQGGHVQGQPQGSYYMTPRSMLPSRKGLTTSARRRKAEREPDEQQAEDEEFGRAKATTSALEQELESTLLAAAACRPKTPLVGATARRCAVAPPIIVTDQGPVPAQLQVVSTKSVTKQPGQPDIIGRDVATIRVQSPCQAERTEVVAARATPHHPGARSPRGKEVVVVQSTVAIAPGLKQTTKTVTYEGDAESVRQASVLPTPTAVAKLVREETAMVNETLAMHMPDVKRVSPVTQPIRKRALAYALDQESVALLEDHELCATCLATPAEQEEPSPEMIAAMMNNEERGLAMAEPPTNVYNYLFAQEGGEHKIEVTSAAAYPLQDVVVPAAQIPDMSMDIPNAGDVLNLSTQAANAMAEDPNAHSYCAVVGAEPVRSKNAARKGGKTRRKRVTPLLREPPPWGAIEDVAPVIDVIGAPLAECRAVREEADEEVDPLVEGIEFLLQTETPQHFSQIQLRGTQKPAWFPGYVMALPDLPNLIGLAKSPSEVFAAAWRATQPDIFEDDSVFII